MKTTENVADVGLRLKYAPAQTELLSGDRVVPQNRRAGRAVNMLTIAPKDSMSLSVFLLSLFSPLTWGGERERRFLPWSVCQTPELGLIEATW
jgi:hypothetical protein